MEDMTYPGRLVDSWGTWQQPHTDGGIPGGASRPIIGASASGGYTTGPYVPGPADLLPPATQDGAQQPPTQPPTGTTATGGGGFDLSSLTSATILGIPILWIGLALAAYFLFFKKR